MESWGLNNSEKKNISTIYYYIYSSTAAVHKHAPGDYCCAGATPEHGEGSRPTESLTTAMLFGVLAVFCLPIFGVVGFVWGFVWLLWSDPVAWKWVVLVESCWSNIFAWISPAPFCTILTPNIKSHRNFLFIGIIDYCKDP